MQGHCSFLHFFPCLLGFTNGTTLPRMHCITTSFPPTPTQLFCGSYIISTSIEILVAKEERLSPHVVEFELLKEQKEVWKVTKDLPTYCHVLAGLLFLKHSSHGPLIVCFYSMSQMCSQWNFLPEMSVGNFLVPVVSIFKKSCLLWYLNYWNIGKDCIRDSQLEALLNQSFPILSTDSPPRGFIKGLNYYIFQKVFSAANLNPGSQCQLCGYYSPCGKILI